MLEVGLEPRPVQALAPVVPQERIDRVVDEVAPRMVSQLKGRDLLNVNSTASGGGVAEMLKVLLPPTQSGRFRGRAHRPG